MTRMHAKKRRLSKRDVVVARGRIPALAFWAALWLVPSVAGAATDVDVDIGQQLAEAEKACLAGAYERGVDLLSALYLKARHPAYLHNQARCYEENGQYRLAVVRYRAFLLKVKELSPAERAAEGLAEDKLAQIEAHLDRVEQLAQASVAPGDADKNPTADSAKAAPSLTEHAGPGDGHAPEGSALRPLGVVAMSLGVVSAVGGVVAGVVSRSAENQIADASKNHGTYDPGLYSRGQRASTIATVGFVAAPLLLTAGAVMYWLGHPTTTATSVSGPAAWQIGPSLSRDGFGLVLSSGY